MTPPDDPTSRTVVLPIASARDTEGTSARAERRFPLRTAAACASAAVLLVAPPAAAAGWLATFSGMGLDFADPETAHAVAVDGSGDVVAAGSVGGSPDESTDLAVVKVSGADGSTLWTRVVDGDFGTSDVARDVEVDASGDVLVAGRIDNRTLSGSFAVLKLSGSDGTELWRAEIQDDLTTAPEIAWGVAVDASGDVLATGTLENSTTHSELAVLKLAGADGSELWRTVITGTDSISSDSGRFVLVDSGGDVVVAGAVDDNDPELTILKFDGTDGSEIWRESVPNSGFARGLALGAGGDIFAAGTKGGGGSMTVTRLAAADGSPLWSFVTSGLSIGVSDAGTLALDGAGGVVVAARLPSAAGDEDMTVIKLDASDGSELWTTYLDGGSNSTDLGLAAAVDGAGDVYATGRLSVPTLGGGLAIAKLAGADGSEIWRRAVYGTDSGGTGFDIAIGATGDPIAVGDVSNSLGGSDDLAVVSLPASDGFLRIFDTIGGRRILVKDKQDDPSKRKIILLAKSFRVSVPEAGGPDDPRTAGATFRLVNPSTGEEFVSTVPGGTTYWKALGNPEGSKGYSYLDRFMDNGPCKKLLIKPDKLLKALCLAKVMPISFDLDEPTQGSLTATLEMGTESAQCVHFGGTVIRDEGVGNPKPNATFLAKEVAATPRCVLPGPPQ